MSEGFHRWLSRQRDRADTVGDLARDAHADPDWDRRSCYSLRDRLDATAAPPEAYDALIQAVHEWLPT